MKMKFWLAAAIAAALSGCAMSEATPGSLGKPGERATVVVGVVASKLHPFQGSGIAASWRQYDAEAEVLLASGGGFTVDRRSECWIAACDLEPRYAAFTVTPGDYILVSVLSDRSGGRSRGELVTFFVKTKRNEPPGGVVRTTPRAMPEGSTAGSGAPRFTVRDGEVVYIGTFAFDTNEWPHRLSAFRADMAAAKAALDAADREKMVFRPPTRPAG